MDYSPWFVLLLGMGTVFIGLLALVLLTKLMSLIITKTADKKKAGSDAHNDLQQVATARQDISYKAPDVGDRKLFDAVIAAAVAQYMGDDVSGIRIKSVKRIQIGATDDRGGFIAAVSAALATAMGEDVSGLRIKSIKRV